MDKKVIFKQIIITLLVCVAIVLVLALIFYQFIPSNKIIPTKVQAYSMPDDIKEEIQENKTEELVGQNQTYEITDADLDLYKANKSYNPGKSDPFAASAVETTTNNVTETKASSGSTTGSGNSNSESNDRNTTDNYYTAAGVGGVTK